MNVSLTPELERSVDAKVESGLYNNASEVVREGLRLLKEQEAPDPYRELCDHPHGVAVAARAMPTWRIDNAQFLGWGLPPRYSFLLNAHRDERFRRCPRCRATTRLRKIPPK